MDFGINPLGPTAASKPDRVIRLLKRAFLWDTLYLHIRHTWGQTGHAGLNNLNRDEESNSLQFSDKGVCLYLSVAVLRME